VKGGLKVGPKKKSPSKIQFNPWKVVRAVLLALIATYRWLTRPDISLYFQGLLGDGNLRGWQGWDEGI